MPHSSSILARMPVKASVSYTLFLPLSTQMVRSRPMPVSTFFCVRGMKEPSFCLLYCMNTSFQISRYAAAVAGRGAIRAAGLLSRDDEHLGVRAAGAGHAGRTPPVVLLGQIEDMIVLYAAAAPQVSALPRRAGQSSSPSNTVKARLVRVDAQPFGAGEKFPAPGNGICSLK